MYPNRTCPFPAAPAQIVLSLDQDIFIKDPTLVLLKFYVQPVLSHNLIMSYEPTAKYSPLGAQDTIRRLNPNILVK